MRTPSTTILAAPLAASLLLLAGSPPSPTPRPVDFNRDIRPILSDRCFPCHGFDAKARKADLRLDQWEGLTRIREGRTPVVPGDPDASELIRRICSDDPGVVMPPPRSQLTLSADERALLRRWIAEGAPFAPHWAFLPPERPPVPTVPPDITTHNPIDDFVAARLVSRGHAPSPSADRATLIRRLSLDLTGLPPTPDEIDAFVGDAAPAAYGKLVDRLLASPHFGERMALVWLDAARYADTNGFHHDNVRTAWPYRDWVIRAFNQNLPYDRFVTEQLAGDLFENPDEQQRIATAFCRMHNINDEGGALDAEYRVEAVCDRIETIATTLMGLTFTCARCHDHKYDPIKQEDYYGLYAFFNSVDERGVYSNDFEQARAYPARLVYYTPELRRRVESAQAALDTAEAELAAAQPRVAHELASWEREFRSKRGVEWVDATIAEATSAGGHSLSTLEDGSVRHGGQPDTDTVTITLRTPATDLRMLRFEALTDESFPGGSIGLASNGNAVVTSIRAEAVSATDPARSSPLEWAWAWADHEQPNGDFDVLNVLRPGAPGWALQGHVRAEPRSALLVANRPFGYEGGTLVRVTIACESRYGRHVVGRPRLSLARVASDVLDDFPIVQGDWWVARPFRGGDFDALFDKSFGPETTTELDIAEKFGEVRWQHQPGFVDGGPHVLEGEHAVTYLARTLHTPVARRLALSLGSDDALRVYLNGDEVHAVKTLRSVAPDQDRVQVDLRAGDNTIVLKVVNNGGPGGFYYRAEPVSEAPARLAPAALVPAEKRDESLARRFLAEWATAHSPTYTRLDARVRELRTARDELEARAVPVIVMRELPEPTPTFVLRRGNYASPDEARPVERRPPRLLGEELPEGAPRNRLGFARWLTRPDHPLFARVHVNRIWQMLFGTGLVKSSENFGHQADWPSHLDLLDWLAVEFAESGWDQKALIRLIVTSATYRQSSVVRADVAATDPENRWLAWFPRRRLPGEMIRDQALFVSGLLSTAIGGPSVKPYQPSGLWREVSIGGSSNTQVFERDDGEALYRRSLYTFWKRTSPNPQMTTFDAPTREFCVVRRGVTNTPLQALVLWNDEQFLEAARVLAQRTLDEQRDADGRLAAMFRRCTGRRPDSEELAVLRRSLRDHRRRYERARDDANALLRNGEAPLPRVYDAAELASWTMIANTILSLDATIVRT